MGQQDPAGQGDIAAESSSDAAAAAAAAPGGPSSEGLVADHHQEQPSYHLPATLDVSDGSGVSFRSRRTAVRIVCHD